MSIGNFCILLFLGAPILLRAPEESSSTPDKMAVRRLASEHTRTFGKDKLIKSQKENPAILTVDIDSLEYANWVEALEESLKKASPDEKTQANVIRLANQFLKKHLDSLDTLDKTQPDAPAKIKNALQKITDAQQKLAQVGIDKTSLIYPAYEFVLATYNKIYNELSTLSKTTGNKNLITYDSASNLIAKQFYPDYYEGEITNIKKLVDISLVDKLRLQKVKSVLIDSINTVQQTRQRLQQAFKQWYQNGYIIIPALSDDQKKAHRDLINKSIDVLQKTQKNLQELQPKTKQFPDIDQKREDYQEVLNRLVSNANDLKVALATA